MKKGNNKSFEIALSAISCAFCTVFLTLGTLNNYMLAVGYVVGALALTLPLAKNFWLGDLLAYIGAVILSLLLGGAAFIWRVVPFITFFGIHPLLNYLQYRLKINRTVAFMIKAILFDLTLFVLWKFVLGMTANFNFIDEYILPVILIGGTLVCYVYDLMIVRCQRSTNAVIYKIKKN